MGEGCGMHGTKNAHQLPVGKPENKRPFERLRHRWEDNIKPYNIKMDLEKIRFKRCVLDSSILG
jgi:hypothetical protein